MVKANNSWTTIEIFGSSQQAYAEYNHCTTSTWCDKTMSSTQHHIFNDVMPWHLALDSRCQLYSPHTFHLFVWSDAVDGVHFSFFMYLFNVHTRTVQTVYNTNIHTNAVKYYITPYYITAWCVSVFDSIPDWFSLSLSSSFSVYHCRLNCHITIKYQIFRWSPFASI